MGRVHYVNLGFRKDRFQRGAVDGDRVVMGQLRQTLAVGEYPEGL